MRTKWRLMCDFPLDVVIVKPRTRVLWGPLLVVLGIPGQSEGWLCHCTLLHVMEYPAHTLGKHVHLGIFI